MNKKESSLLSGIYNGSEQAREIFRKHYGEFLRNNPLFDRDRRIAPPWTFNEIDRVLAYFIRIASERDLSGSRLTIGQMLHIVAIDLFIIEPRRRFFEPRPPFDTIVSARAEVFATVPGDLESEWSHTDVLGMDTDIDLTLEYLLEEVLPPVGALASMQDVFSNLRNYAHRNVVIRVIKQQSPIDISLDGAAEAVEALKEDIIPWRRRNAQRLADLKAKDAEVEISKKRAEATQVRASTEKDRAEAEKIQAEAAKLREEAEKQKIENDKLRFELESAKLQLAIDIVSKMRPDLPDSEKLVYAFKLLPSINTLAASTIEPRLIKEQETNLLPEQEG